MRIWTDSTKSRFLEGQLFDYSRNETPAGIACVEYHHPDNTPAEPIVWAQTFQRMFGALNGKYFVGEGINNGGQFIDPPEAFLTQNPAAGEIIDTSSIVYTSATDSTVAIPAYRWKYKTLAHYDTYGNLPWSDCWQTALLEYAQGGAPGVIYNFTFARDIGLVHVLIGVIGANNTIAGHELYLSTYTPPQAVP